MSAEFDFVIRAGRVVCPSQAIDSPGAVAVAEGRIVAVGDDVQGLARRTFDFPNGILLPGLIDLHAHPARTGSKYGVDPDQEFLPRGVTTVLSQGDAGADDLADYLQSTIRASRTRVRLALNLSRRGESTPGGCFEDESWADIDACVQAIRSAGDDIWGIAANVSEIACGMTDPRSMLDRAIAAANAANCPLLFGIHHPARWPLDEQLQRLRPGDVMTYCFRGGPHAIVGKDGRVLPEVWAARARGVLFDVGHGRASFSFAVACAAIADGFPPDTISTDSYRKHVGLRPAHDLPRTMSKLRAAGMTETEIFRAVTSRPAEILRESERIGALRVDRVADLTVLVSDDNETLTDVDGVARVGRCWRAALTVRAGETIFPDAR